VNMKQTSPHPITLFLFLAVECVWARVWKWFATKTFTLLSLSFFYYYYYLFYFFYRLNTLPFKSLGLII